MLRVGIFFGGNSREREISFAGGRTVYDNLDKALFEPVPIFVDSLLNFIRLDWQYLYKGSIRDFYPPVAVLPPSPHEFQIYIESLGKLTADQQADIIGRVGTKIQYHELSHHIDLAFLALHGNFGEDGQLQGLLDALQIPYTGSGIRASTIGMDKSFQKKMMTAGGFAGKPVHIIRRKAWLQQTDYAQQYETVARTIGFPLVIRSANQGSSIGVTIVHAHEGVAGYINAIEKGFFIDSLSANVWQGLSPDARIAYLRQLTDIREGLGFPIEVTFDDGTATTFYHPEALLIALDAPHWQTCRMAGHLSEQTVVIEGFIQGREFSCIVIQDDEGTPIALPPTEIVKGKEVFDYRAKYLPGLSRKITPIDLPTEQIAAIRQACERLFSFFEFNTYARIDGFISPEGTIFLNDPNTTSGMLPSSFFFHQAAEIGLNPSQFLTYIVRTSLQERLRTTMHKTHYDSLLLQLEAALHSQRTTQAAKKKVAVIMGGYSFERHISVESGRNVFEKLASSDKYEPIPFFLLGDAQQFDLYQMPLTLLFKDNADDIREKILHFHKHEVTEHIKAQCQSITELFAASSMVFSPQHRSFAQLKEMVDVVFIALHGRPGEDGALQAELDKVGLPYNGSGVASSRTTIDKYATLQRLQQHGFPVAMQQLVSKSAYQNAPADTLQLLATQFGFPLVAKPVDDGCSSAVKVIKNSEQLAAYCEAIFRPAHTAIGEDLLPILQLKPKEEFPAKETILIESLITANGADRFMEVTGGMLTHYLPSGEMTFEVFEPSEALSAGEVLSLEEKFLAGEGQNLTPARFGTTPAEYTTIAAQVKHDLQRAAQILGVEGYARIDAFVRIYAPARAETVIIEVNSLPGMTPATCIFHQAALNGYKPYQFIDQLLTFALERKARGCVK